MKYLLFLLLASIVQSGAFIATVNGGTDADFARAAAETTSLLNRFFIVDYDVQIAFFLGAMPSDVLGQSVYQECVEGAAPLILMPAALYIQQHNGSIDGCLRAGASFFYHAIVLITDDCTVPFFTGSDVVQIAAGQYDMVSVMLHEAMHGLGIYSSVTADCTFARAPLITLFDTLLFHLSGSTPQPLDSRQCALLTNGQLAYGSTRLYSSAPFRARTTAQHARMGLMNFQSPRGQTVRSLDAFSVRVLTDMGYDVRHCETPDWSTACGFCDLHIACISSSGIGLLSFVF